MQMSQLDGFLPYPSLLTSRLWYPQLSIATAFAPFTPCTCSFKVCFRCSVGSEPLFLNHQSTLSGKVGWGENVRSGVYRNLGVLRVYQSAPTLRRSARRRAELPFSWTLCRVDEGRGRKFGEPVHHIAPRTPEVYTSAGARPVGKALQPSDSYGTRRERDRQKTTGPKISLRLEA